MSETPATVTAQQAADEQIAARIHQAIGVDIKAADISGHYAPPETRGHRG